MSRYRICVQSAVNGEFTICGDAFDAFQTGNADEEHDTASHGGTVTCPKCCAIVADIRANRYRLKPREGASE